MVPDQPIVIPDYLSKSFVEKALQNGLENSKLTVTSVRFEMGTSVGDNYCSDIYRAHIEYRSSPESKCDKRISVVIKSMPFTEMRGPVLIELDVFAKEVEIITKVLDRLSTVLDGEALCAK